MPLPSAIPWRLGITSVLLFRRGGQNIMVFVVKVSTAPAHARCRGGTIVIIIATTIIIIIIIGVVVVLSGSYQSPVYSILYHIRKEDPYFYLFFSYYCQQ